MNNNRNRERLEYFAKVQEQTPEDFRNKYTQTIIDGVIIEGMTPYEAYLAGGQFSYQVTADKEVWSAGRDPMRVMWMQTHRPDNSEIVMTFKNNTQFNSDEPIAFKVLIEKGLVVQILNTSTRS